MWMAAGIQLVCLPALFSAEAGGTGLGKKEGTAYAYGPFGGKDTFARDASGGEARYRVPGRMRVARPAKGPEFTLVKFLLVETKDEKAQGLEEGFVEMGGFVAFSIAPVEPETQEAGAPERAHHLAPVLWKGLEVRLPGFKDRPKILSGGGAIGSQWNLNLLLEREIFDPLWVDAEAAGADAGGGHRLVPLMTSTLVYRNYLEIEPDEQGTYIIRREPFQKALNLEAAGAGFLVTGFLTDGDGDEEPVLNLMRGLVRNGEVEGLNAGLADSVSPALLLGLFAAARQQWLKYVLEPQGRDSSGLLAARWKTPDTGETLPEKLSFGTAAWVPVEAYRRILVEIESATCGMDTIRQHGFHRETKLDLEFIPYGDWTDSGITRARMLYELRTDERVVDFGSVVVPTDTTDATLRTAKSLDGERVRFRCKPAGYWRDGRFSPLRSAEWVEEPASLRRHFHYLIPEDFPPRPGAPAEPVE